mgnify:FL=1
MRHLDFDWGCGFPYEDRDCGQGEIFRYSWASWTYSSSIVFFTLYLLFLGPSQARMVGGRHVHLLSCDLGTNSRTEARINQGLITTFIKAFIFKPLFSVTCCSRDQNTPLLYYCLSFYFRIFFFLPSYIESLTGCIFELL